MVHVRNHFHLTVFLGQDYYHLISKTRKQAQVLLVSQLRFFGVFARLPQAVTSLQVGVKEKNDCHAQEFDGGSV